MLLLGASEAIKRFMNPAGVCRSPFLFLVFFQTRKNSDPGAIGMRH
jgi:hypothetical protein